MERLEMVLPKAPVLTVSFVMLMGHAKVHCRIIFFQRDNIIVIIFSNKYRKSHIAKCLFVVDLWIEEVPGSSCTPYIATASVGSQRECQSNCVQDSECVGIVYGHKIGNTHFCYICHSDNLNGTINNFGFYRRPGNVKYHWFKLFIFYWIHLSIWP